MRRSGPYPQHVGQFGQVVGMPFGSQPDPQRRRRSRSPGRPGPSAPRLQTSDESLNTRRLQWTDVPAPDVVVGVVRPATMRSTDLEKPLHGLQPAPSQPQRMTVSIKPLESLDPAEVLDLIGLAFRWPRTSAWYRWKHVEGPWGPSIGLGAVEGGRLLGLRLLLPWRLEVQGAGVRCFRAVEAATHPDARGRGLFSELNSELMARLAEEGPTILFSTPNENSRRAYLRLGWSWLGPILHQYSLVTLAPWRAVAPADAVVTPAFPEGAAVATRWGEPAWRWRLDPRSGRCYATSAVMDATGTHGLTYRATSVHGVRCLLVLASWGRPGPLRRATVSAALRERAPLILEAAGVGAARPLRRLGHTRGGSLLAVWTSDDELLGPARDLSSWRAGFAELESVL